MFRIVFDIILPIVLGLMLVIEIMIPSFFPSMPYFWFFKSFRKKPNEISKAEADLKQAMDNMEALKNASETDKQVAELRIKEAQQALDRVIENKEKPKQQ